MKIGDRIKDIEDGDCYFEGVVVSLNPLKYKVDRVIWDDCDILNDDFIGKVITPRWYWLEKI